MGILRLVSILHARKLSIANVGPIVRDVITEFSGLPRLQSFGSLAMLPSHASLPHQLQFAPETSESETQKHFELCSLENWTMYKVQKPLPASADNVFWASNKPAQ
jgi:hypothetical protein